MKLNKLSLGIVAAAITATAISVPAKADSNKELNTLLAILAGGLIINEVVDRKKDREEEVPQFTRRRDRDYYRDESVTHRHRDGRLYTHESMADLKWYHRNDGKRHPKPGLLWDRDRNPNPAHRHPKVSLLDKLPLPGKCHRTIRLRNGKTKNAYRERCLKKHGYRVNDAGVVSHRKWPRLTRRPNLI